MRKNAHLQHLEAFRLQSAIKNIQNAVRIHLNIKVYLYKNTKLYDTGDKISISNNIHSFTKGLLKNLPEALLFKILLCGH